MHRDASRQPAILFWAPYRYEWTRVELRVPGLPAGLEGLRIVHITDLHFRAHWASVYDRIIERVNAAGADLVVMTGDFVDLKDKAGPAAPFAERFFSPLRGKLGQFAIFGNHDNDLLYRFARDLVGRGELAGEPWPARPLSELRRSAARERTLEFAAEKVPQAPSVDGKTIYGFTILDDGRLVLRHNGAAIELIGFRGTERDEFNDAFYHSLPAAKEAGTLRVILSHHPDNVRVLERLKADVILSGHTHGGQVCLPWGRPIITHDSLPKAYCAGVHRWGGSWLVIPRGLGFSSLPVRAFCPPEVMEIVLRG